MEGNDKRPVKGILKASSSFDKQEKAANRRSKNAKWDEMNIMATFHPADKDYGHMKVEEPKTPYNWEYSEQEAVDQLDSGVLADKLASAASSSRRRSTPSASEDDSEEDDDANLDETERARKREFRNRRKTHYNEFKAVQLARKLIEEEDDEEEDSSSSKPSEPAADQV